MQPSYSTLSALQNHPHIAISGGGFSTQASTVSSAAMSDQKSAVAKMLFETKVLRRRLCEAERDTWDSLRTSNTVPDEVLDGFQDTWFGAVASQPEKLRNFSSPNEFAAKVADAVMKTSNEETRKDLLAKLLESVFKLLATSEMTRFDASERYYPNRTSPAGGNSPAASGGLGNYSMNNNAVTHSPRLPVQHEVVSTSAAEIRDSETDGTRSINQYVILQPIASGSQGTVYLGIDAYTSEFRAIKEIYRPNPSISSIRAQLASARVRQRLQREVDVMKVCVHPNLVTLYEVIDDPNDNSVYLVLKYIDNGPVLEMCADGTSAQGRSLPLHKVARFGRQLASALAFLHDHGVVHRDIKPDNVLLGNDDQVFLGDFGISEMLKRTAQAPPTEEERQEAAVLRAAAEKKMMMMMALSTSQSGGNYNNNNNNNNVATTNDTNTIVSQGSIGSASNNAEESGNNNNNNMNNNITNSAMMRPMNTTNASVDWIETSSTTTGGVTMGAMMMSPNFYRGEGSSGMSEGNITTSASGTQQGATSNQNQNNANSSSSPAAHGVPPLMNVASDNLNNEGSINNYNNNKTIPSPLKIPSPPQQIQPPRTSIVGFVGVSSSSMTDSTTGNILQQNNMEVNNNNIVNINADPDSSSNQQQTDGSRRSQEQQQPAAAILNTESNLFGDLNSMNLNSYLLIAQQLRQAELEQQQQQQQQQKNNKIDRDSSIESNRNSNGDKSPSHNNRETQNELPPRPVRTDSSASLERIGSMKNQQQQHVPCSPTMPLNSFMFPSNSSTGNMNTSTNEKNGGAGAGGSSKPEHDNICNIAQPILLQPHIGGPSTPQQQQQVDTNLSLANYYTNNYQQAHNNVSATFGPLNYSQVYGQPSMGNFSQTKHPLDGYYENNTGSNRRRSTVFGGEGIAGGGATFPSMKHQRSTSSLAILAGGGGNGNGTARIGSNQILSRSGQEQEGNSGRLIGMQQQHQQNRRPSTVGLRSTYQSFVQPAPNSSRGNLRSLRSFAEKGLGELGTRAFLAPEILLIEDTPAVSPRSNTGSGGASRLVPSPPSTSKNNNNNDQASTTTNNNNSNNAMAHHNSSNLSTSSLKPVNSGSSGTSSSSNPLVSNNNNASNVNKILNSPTKNYASTTAEDEKRFEIFSRGDVWALGLTLYVMVYAKLPFDCCHGPQNFFDDVVSKQKEIPFPEIGPLGTRVPEALILALKFMLSKDPTKRATARQMKSIFRQLDYESEAWTEMTLPSRVSYRKTARMLKERHLSAGMLLTNNNSSNSNNNNTNRNIPFISIPSTTNLLHPTSFYEYRNTSSNPEVYQHQQQLALLNQQQFSNNSNSNNSIVNNNLDARNSASLPHQLSHFGYLNIPGSNHFILNSAYSSNVNLLNGNNNNNQSSIGSGSGADYSHQQQQPSNNNFVSGVYSGGMVPNQRTKTGSNYDMNTVLTNNHDGDKNSPTQTNQEQNQLRTEPERKQSSLFSNGSPTNNNPATEAAMTERQGSTMSTLSTQQRFQQFVATTSDQHRLSTATTMSHEQSNFGLHQRDTTLANNNLSCVGASVGGGGASGSNSHPGLLGQVFVDHRRSSLSTSGAQNNNNNMNNSPHLPRISSYNKSNNNHNDDDQKSSKNGNDDDDDDHDHGSNTEGETSKRNMNNNFAYNNSDYFSAVNHLDSGRSNNTTNTLQSQQDQNAISYSRFNSGFTNSNNNINRNNNNNKQNHSNENQMVTISIQPASTMDVFNSNDKNLIHNCSTNSINTNNNTNNTNNNSTQGNVSRSDPSTTKPITAESSCDIRSGGGGITHHNHEEFDSNNDFSRSEHHASLKYGNEQTMVMNPDASAPNFDNQTFAYNRSMGSYENGGSNDHHNSSTTNHNNTCSSDRPSETYLPPGSTSDGNAIFGAAGNAFASTVGPTDMHETYFSNQQQQALSPGTFASTCRPKFTRGEDTSDSSDADE